MDLENINSDRPKPTAKNKILIVDDQEFNLKALEIMLQYKLNVDVLNTCVRALSGKQAIEIVKEDMKKNKYSWCSFKLILMDYEMPDLDGPDTTSQIRDLLYFENIDQPIIAGITGHSDKKYLERAIKQGMNIIF